MVSPSKTEEQRKFKVVLVGDGGTGKTSYINRLQKDEFVSEYVATLGVEKYSLKVNTTHGNYTINLWDTSGQEKLGPMRDSYYEGADAAILFFDVTSRITYKNIPGWHQDIVRIRKNIPVVVCANKTDVEDRKVKSKTILYPSKHDLGLYEISVKDGIKIRHPIQYLLEKLTDTDLEIVDLDDSFNSSFGKPENKMQDLSEENSMMETQATSDSLEKVDNKVDEIKEEPCLMEADSTTDIVDAGKAKEEENSLSNETHAPTSIPKAPVVVGIVAPSLFKNLGTSKPKAVKASYIVRPATQGSLLKPSSFGSTSVIKEPIFGKPVDQKNNILKESKFNSTTFGGESDKANLSGGQSILNPPKLVNINADGTIKENSADTIEAWKMWH